MNAEKRRRGVAIIACGARGQAHAGSWAKLDGAAIKVVTDSDRARAEDLAKKYGAQIADDYREAIDRDDVEIVSVCTPACFHAEPTVFAADHGKHVLCEKPMALNITDAERMIDAARRNRTKLSFSFQMQYCGVTQKLREIMDAGEIGRPVMARVVASAEIRPKLAMHSRTGNNGPVNDICCHTFTLWRHIFRSEPVRVQAAGMSIAKDAEVLRGIKDIAIDTATILVTFASGDVGVYSISWGLPRGSKWVTYQDILGPKGMIKPGNDTLTFIKGAEETVVKNLTPTAGDDAQAAAFLQCVEQDTEPRNGPRDALIALEMSLAALESIETGQTVNVDV